MRRRIKQIQNKLLLSNCNEIELKCEQFFDRPEEELIPPFNFTANVTKFYGKSLKIQRFSVLNKSNSNGAHHHCQPMQMDSNFFTLSMCASLAPILAIVSLLNKWGNFNYFYIDSSGWNTIFAGQFSPRGKLWIHDSNGPQCRSCLFSSCHRWNCIAKTFINFINFIFFLEDELVEVGNLIVTSRFRPDGHGVVNLTWEVPEHLRGKIRCKF